DPAIAAEQHEALCELLRGAGAEVVYAAGDVGDDPDAVYVFDPVMVSERGALLLRPGKEGRRSEPPAIAEDLRALGVPTAFEMREPATAEGGDTMWVAGRPPPGGAGSADRVRDAGAGDRRGRRHDVARRAHAPDRPQLPDQRRRHRRAAPGAARRRGARVRPAAGAG